MFFRRSRRETALEDLDQQIRDHIEQDTQDNIARGMSFQDARNAALRKFGNVALVKEDAREVWTIAWLDNLIRDFRFAIRTLRKSPAFTMVAVLTLALGIGATTAIFSLVDVILFRPLPIARPGEVMRITGSDTKDISKYYSVSFPAYLEYRDGTSAFTGVAAVIDRLPVNFTAGAATADRIEAGMVTGNYFDVLGVKPEIGRVLRDEDDRVGAAPVAMLSHDLWKREFAGGGSVLGNAIVIDGEVFTVVGVTPAGFGGVAFDNLPEVWLPAQLGFTLDPLLKSQMPLGHYSFGPFFAVARLRPGVSITAAQAQLDALAERLGAGKPVAGEHGYVKPWPVLVPAAQEARDEWTKYSFTILGTVLLVLLIACANASGLLLAHAEGRRKEIAVRTALGATRWRIVRMQLIQGLLVALAASAIGCALAGAGVALLLSTAPSALPIPAGRATSILDPRVLLFAVATAVVCALVSGLGPAVRSAQMGLHSAMKAESFSGGLSLGRATLRNLFVAVQVAASVVLLVGAGLMARTVWRMTHVPVGFDPSHILTASTDPIREGYDKAGAAALLGPLLDALRAQPGVQAAALGTTIPPRGNGTSANIQGRKGTTEFGTPIQLLMASPGYFHALGIQLLRGREFGASDTANAPGVMIANEAAVREYWPGEDPIEKRLDGVGPHDETFEIVGVSGNVVTGFSDFSPKPAFYIPIDQGYNLFPWEPDITLIARGSGDPNTMLPALREAVRRVNPNLPLFQVHTMEEQVERAEIEQRFLGRLLVILAAIATLLCAAGIYAQASYATEALTREFGIRLALGALPRQVFAMVLRRGIWLAAGGLVIGLAAALALTRILASLLYGVSPFDAATFAGVFALFLLVALAACLVPARRASKADPISALKYE